MKKIISAILLALLIVTFTACNNTNNDSVSSQETPSYVGAYESVIPAEGEYGSEETYRIELSSDGTFTMSVETFDSWRDEEANWKLYEATGVYIKEDNQWLLLTGDKIMYNYRDTGESEETLSQEDGNTLYVSIKDNNTLLVENSDWKVKGEKPSQDEMTEFTRVN